MDKAAQKRVRALIERETSEPGAHAPEERVSWTDFLNATYGSLADDPMDEIDHSSLPPPMRDEIE